MTPDSATDGPVSRHGRDAEVVLVRHGETEWSRDGLHTGRTNLPLTDLGRIKAAALSATLADRTFARVFCSPLARARRTYELSGLDAPVEFVDDLMEWDYGVYEGVSTAEVRATIPGWTVWTHAITGGESVEDVGDRADRVIERVTAVAGDVALFSHGQYLRILAARWLGLPADAGRLLALDTSSVSALGYERETRVIRRWNQTGAHGQPAG